MSNKNDKNLTMRYGSSKLAAPEAKFLLMLEMSLGKELPNLSADEFKRKGFGFVIKNGNVIYLGLRNKYLYSLPNSIDTLQKLKILDLLGNPFIKLPETIKNLKNLQEIILHEKNIQKRSKIIENIACLNLTCLYDSKKNSVHKNSNNSVNINNSINTIDFRRKFSVYLKSKLQRNLVRANGNLKIQNETISSINCDKCKGQEFKSIKISLELVRKSPRKLVFVISSIIIECILCKKIRKITKPNPFFISRTLGFNEILQKELRFQIKQNLYCKMCNDYYKNFEKCPKHYIKLSFSTLVFVRGINQQ
ncbi:MAG: hypothetical protein ACFFAN_13885, partial [Promethearchaeota archaeon]